MLRSVDWWLFTDISGKPIRPTLNNQALQEEWLLFRFRWDG